MSDFLSVKQLAEHLQVSDKTIYRMLWRGDLPGHRVGSQWRFSRSEVDYWLDLRMPRLAQADLREMSRGGGGTLASALTVENALILLSAQTPGEVIREFIERVHFPEPVDRAALAARIRDRENTSSTSTAQGVAILHTARWESRVLTRSNTFAIGRLPLPGDFGSPDGGPVDLLFLLLAADHRHHLALLAGAARLIRVPGLLTAIRAARDGPEVIDLIGRAERTLEHELESQASCS